MFVLCIRQWISLNGQVLFRNVSSLISQRLCHCIKCMVICIRYWMADDQKHTPWSWYLLNKKNNGQHSNLPARGGSAGCYMIEFSWWRHQMESFSALLALCKGNSSVKGSVKQSFDVFFNLRLNTRLSKQSRRRWFETPSCPLWRHCNFDCQCVTVRGQRNI